MSARSSFFKIAAKAGMLFGAMFVVTVLLAAIPAHQQQAVAARRPPELAGPAASSFPRPRRAGAGSDLRPG